LFPNILHFWFLFTTVLLKEWVCNSFVPDGSSLWKGLSEYFRFYNREKLHRVRDIVRRMTRFYEKDAGGQRLKTAKEANKILLSK
jgi:N-glycosylase/DNA lyase